MNNRRKMLGIVTGFFLGLRAKAQTPARAPASELGRHELTGVNAGMEVVLADVTAPAGAAGGAHRHPGFVMGYVLEGELKFAINGGTPQVVKTGGTFFEPIGALHTTSASANPNAPVRFLAFMVVPKGSRLSLPA